MTDYDFNLTAEEKLVKARVKLQREKPFFSYLLMNLNFVEQKEIETMAVDKYGNCYYCPTWVDKLAPEELKGVLCHEVMHCLNGSSIVGDKLIKDVSKGDIIIDINGKTSKVLKFDKRKYSGNILNIKTVGGYDLKITPNHRILVSVRQDKTIWESSEKLIKGDYLLIPKLKSNFKYNEYNLNLEKYMSGNKWSIPKQLFDKYLNPDISYFLGLYTADGWTSKHKDDSTIGIILDAKDELTIIKVSDIITKQFGLKTRLIKEDNCIRLLFNSNILKRFLREEIGTYSSNKKIPYWIMFNPDTNIILSYIRGIYKGDGCLYNKGNKSSVSYTTVNNVLATNLQQLLLREELNIYTSKYKSLSKECKIKGKLIHSKEQYKLICNEKFLFDILEYPYEKKRHTRYYKDFGNYIGVKIKSINKEEFNDYVYNIKTESGNYTANNLIVHNCALEHMDRCKDRYQPVFNISADVIINSIILEQGLQLPKEVILPNNNQVKLYGVKIDNVNLKSAEEIYDELWSVLSKEYDREMKMIEDFIKKHADSKKGFDKHIYSDGKDGKGKDKGIGGKEIFLPKDWKNILIDACTFARQRGDLPAGMERIVGKLLETYIDWRGLLYRYITSQIPVDYTWARPSKKSYSLGYYMPAVTREQIEIKCAVDTSGSIGQDELTEFISELTGIVKSFKNVDLTVIDCDAAVNGVHELKHATVGEIITKIGKKLKGGGGTSHKPVFEWINKNAPNTKFIICFTDGCTEFPPKSEVKQPVLWVLGGYYRASKENFPFGEVIELPKRNR